MEKERNIKKNGKIKRFLFFQDETEFFCGDHRKPLHKQTYFATIQAESLLMTYSWLRKNVRDKRGNGQLFLSAASVDLDCRS